MHGNGELGEGQAGDVIVHADQAVRREDDAARAHLRAKFRATLTRVLIVQLLSVIVLGLIQIVYNR